MTSTNVICVRKRWRHHTQSGGYDRLAQVLGARTISRTGGRALSQMSRVWRKVFPRTSRYLVDYQLGDRITELRVIARCLARPPQVLHVLYGDEQLNLILRFRRLVRCPLVVTFHLPAPRMQARIERYQPALGARIDRAILVCTADIPDVERWVGDGKVGYVPHGIDTTVFCPASTRPSSARLRVVSVGHHMRDWEAAHSIISEVARRDLAIEFVIISNEQYRNYLSALPNTEFLTDVSESELVNHYQNADVAFIPVLDATANNSILEALACGTPVISNRIRGVPDYLGEDAGWLFELHEVDRIVELLDLLAADPARAGGLREPARMRALGYDWDVVADQVRAIYADAIGSSRDSNR